MKPDMYKAEQEAFVSNLSGTTADRVLSCVLHVPLLLLLLKIIQGTNKPYIVRDIVLLVFPLVITMTVGAEENHWTLAGLSTLLVLIVMTRRYPKKAGESSDDSMGAHYGTYYLTLVKGSNVLLTCIAILAVDFQIFPRSFGKTETFGISLMDVGVGSFIVSTAITSKYARGSSSTSTNTIASTTSSNTNTNTSIFSGYTSVNSKFKALCKQLPYQKLLVLLLGVGRIVAIKALNYQEHVSEYGVHWNFFVTLYCVWTAAGIIHSILTSRVYIVLFSVMVLCMYQYALTHTALTEYIFHAPRDTLFSANKEGILSLFGYVPLHLLSETISYVVFFNQGRGDRREFTTQRAADKTVLRIRATKVDGNNGDDDDAEEKLLLLGENETDSTDDAEYELVDGNHKHGGKTPQIAVDDNNSAKSVPTTTSTATTATTSISTTITMSKQQVNPTMHVSPWNKRMVSHLVLACILSWLVWAVSDHHIQRTSRRLVNISYVALSLAVASTTTLGTYIADILGNGGQQKVDNNNEHTPQQQENLPAVSSQASDSIGSKSPIIIASPVPIRTLELMCKHSLVVFLAGNLMTGAINGTIQTIHTPPLPSLLIVSVYCVALTVIAWGCEWVAARRAGKRTTRGKESA